jgi:hypothetical protein
MENIRIRIPKHTLKEWEELAEREGIDRNDFLDNLLSSYSEEVLGKGGVLRSIESKLDTLINTLELEEI